MASQFVAEIIPVSGTGGPVTVVVKTTGSPGAGSVTTGIANLNLAVDSAKASIAALVNASGETLSNAKLIANTQ